MAPFLIITTGHLGAAIFIEAALSFVGVGVPPPMPSWGNMLGGVLAEAFKPPWWMVVFPGAAITVTILAVNLFGDALRDFLDPKLHVRRLVLALRSIAVVGVVATLLAVSDAGADSARGRPARFVTVAPGIAHATFEVQPDDAEAFSGHAFTVDLDVVDLRLIPAGGPSSRRTVAEIVAQYPAVVAINASFFDTDGRAMGLAVDGDESWAAASGGAGARS